MNSARQEVLRRRLLLVEEDRHTIDAMRDEFMEHGLECEVTLEMDTARGILHNRMMDVVVINARLPGVSDERLVKELAAIKRVPIERLRPWSMGTGPAVRAWLEQRGFFPEDV